MNQSECFGPSNRRVKLAAWKNVRNAGIVQCHGKSVRLHHCKDARKQVSNSWTPQALTLHGLTPKGAWSRWQGDRGDYRIPCIPLLENNFGAGKIMVSETERKDDTWL